ncbi:MAG: inositol monophosphatase [Candidatus Cloacimonetes bacterium]|nr:inositol monophosphatase [Candidatus Cloacimonadota bacterium]
MSELYTKVETIIREAGEILKNAFYDIKKVSTKSNSSDLVTETDKEIERFLINKLGEILPDSLFLAEESDAEHKQADKLWIIDPIDGTTNFVHQFPFVCISVALMIKGQLEYGFVYNPVINEFFSAQRGKGTFLNGVKLEVSEQSDFTKSLLGTGFSYGFKTAKIDNISIYRDLLGKVHGIRRPGSAALDLCYVAKGVYEGYWEFYLNPWDVCAGILIVQEAGGQVSNREDKGWTFNDELIIASNGRIHDTLMKELNDHINLQSGNAHENQ